MSQEIDTARDDLSFLKTLVTEGGQIQSTLGLVLFVAGMCYGPHTQLWGLIELGLLPRIPPNLLGLIWSMLPTAVFIAFLCWILWKDRGSPAHGVSSRALNAAFGGGGLASLTSAVVFGYLAISRGEIFIWMFHPITIFIVQGTVWYIAFAIRRRWWLGLVSIGWHVSAVVLAVLLQQGQIGALLLVLGTGLVLLMALPGWVLWKGASRGA